jgi:6-phosphogluconolactonase/glucosamine-6-phosphate isomerase/deaminase
VLASAHVWIVAVGPRKAPILQYAISRRGSSTPLELVVSQGRNVVVWTDQVLKQESRV